MTGNCSTPTNDMSPIPRAVPSLPLMRVASYPTLSWGRGARPAMPFITSGFIQQQPQLQQPGIPCSRSIGANSVSAAEQMQRRQQKGRQWQQQTQQQANGNAAPARSSETEYFNTGTPRPGMTPRSSMAIQPVPTEADSSPPKLCCICLGAPATH